MLAEQGPSQVDGIIALVGGIAVGLLGVAVVRNFRGLTSRYGERLPKSWMFRSVEHYRTGLGFGALVFGVVIIAVGGAVVVIRA
jgi:hypothetical protein